VGAREISKFFIGWRLFEAISDAEAHLFVQPVHLDAKRVDRTAELLRKQYTVIAIQSVSFAIIEDEYLALLRLQLIQAVLQTSAERFSFIFLARGAGLRRIRHIFRHGTAMFFDLPVEIFERYETGDALYVFGRIALVGAFDRRQLANRAIKGFVGQFFGRGAAAIVEDGYQASAYGLVFAPCLLAVGVQPIEKAFKRLSGELQVLQGVGHIASEVFDLIRIYRGGQTCVILKRPSQCANE
jgi:hypothetical protein